MGVWFYDVKDGQELDLLHIDQVGAGSLMYASDYPHSDMDWGRVDAIRKNDSITREERDALLGGNAQRFYKLELG